MTQEQISAMFTGAIVKELRRRVEKFERRPQDVRPCYLVTITSIDDEGLHGVGIDIHGHECTIFTPASELDRVFPEWSGYLK